MTTGKCRRRPIPTHRDTTFTVCDRSLTLPSPGSRHDLRTAPPRRRRGLLSESFNNTAPLRPRRRTAVRHRSSRRPGRVLERRDASRRRVLRRVVFRAYVRGDGRLPPLLLASHVQDEPRVSVRARIPRTDDRAERRTLVGRSPPPSSSLLGSARRPAFARHRRVLVLARRLALQRHGGNGLQQNSRLRRIPRAALPEPLSPAATHSARRRDLSVTWVVRFVHRLLPEHHPHLACDIHDQLAVARLRQAPFCHLG